MGKKRDEKGSKPLNTLKKTKSLWALLKEFGGHGGTPIIEVINAKATISHVRNVVVIRPSVFLLEFCYTSIVLLGESDCELQRPFREYLGVCCKEALGRKCLRLLHNVLSGYEKRICDKGDVLYCTPRIENLPVPCYSCIFKF